MYNCELFIPRSGKDYHNLAEQLNSVASSLYQRNIKVVFQTDISQEKNIIIEALKRSEEDSSNIEYFIFANILDSKDSSSFESIFTDYINEKEETLENKNNGTTPKLKVSSLGDLGNGYKGYCFKCYNKHYIVLPDASLCDKENFELINDAIDKACEKFTTNEETAKDGITYIKKSDKRFKPKEGFFKRTFPHKGDSGKTKARKIVVLVAFLAILVALGYMLDYFVIAPMLNNKINSEIQKIAYQQTGETGVTKSAQNWKALKKINKEIVGWITLKNTKIDYPVLEHKGDSQYDQYYLYKNYKKEYSVYGIPFIDYRSTDSTKSKNLIVHGHNMNDGSMFHELMNYGDLTGDLSYYRKHPIITFNTPDSDNEWKIISVFKTNTLYAHGMFFNYMQGTFSSDAEFMNFVYNVKVRSLFNIPVMVNENDQLLTLSTCSYEFSNFRTVVVARKVRPGEDTKVNVELATRNKNALYPDVFYEYRGGTKPNVTTFKTALGQNEITWYDGKGDLKGSETLTGTVAANPTEPPTEKPNGKNKKKPTQPDFVTFYTINFLDCEGNVYESQTVQQGGKATFPKTPPAHPSDDYYDYIFKYWQLDGLDGFDMNNVQFGVDIAPYYEAVLKQ